MLVVIRVAGDTGSLSFSNPSIHFADLELQEFANLMGRQMSSYDPFVDRVPLDSQVLSDLFNRYPPSCHSCLLKGLGRSLLLALENLIVWDEPMDIKNYSWIY
jgi:hypothetical protein